MHIFHALFTRYQGGLEQAYVNATDALKARNHRVTALLRPDAPYKQEVAVHAHDVITSSPNGFYDIAAIWKIRRRIKALRPDVLIAHNGRAIALLAYASWGMDIPLIGVSHSYKTARAFHADRLVVLSEHMKQHFLKAGYSKPITIIPNLIHLPPAPVFKKRGAPVVIGAIGRFSEEKGFADFMYALHELKQGGVDFQVQLAGDGPELANLKALEEQFGLAPYIKWVGWVSDKAAFYRELDILCLPSRVDSFPMVVLETLAYGVPIVATDAPGPVSILTDGVNGLLVPRQDYKAMAQAFQKLTTQPELAEKIAKAGWEKAQEFGFERVAALWDKEVST